MNEKENIENLKEEYEKIKKARECVRYLSDCRFLYKYHGMEENLLKDIDDYSIQRNVFITKPFYTCDSMGTNLYRFMYSLKRNLNKVKINETE